MVMNSKRSFLSRGTAFFVACAMVVLCPVPALFADPNVSTDVRVRYLEWPSNDVQRSDTLYISKDTSQVLRFDRRIVRTAISNPELCDFTPLSPKEILVYAKKPGLANLIVWDEKDKVATYDLYSVLDTDKLKEVLKGIDPENMFQVLPFNETLAVYGMTPTAAKLKRINQAVASYDAKGVSFVTVKDPKQILLEVRFAEINRNGAEDYGLDLEAFLTTDHHVSVFRSMYGGNAVNAEKDDFINPSPYAKRPFGPMESGSLGMPDSSSNADIYATVFGKNLTYSPMLQWLQEKNVLKVIARPNLLAKDGEEAKFHVGGEYPIPLQTANTVSVEYKTYGTQLNFTPEVLDNGAIRLKVKTEVSELDYANTVTITGNQIPGLIERKHETVAELSDGETLLIGGMITQRISEGQSKLPFFGDLPGLKYLFQKKSYARTDVELIVIVTPHIVSAFQLREQKKYFSPDMIKKLEDAARVYKPGFRDIQGDAINQVIAQGEERADFAEFRKVRDEAIEGEVKAQIGAVKAGGRVPMVVSIPSSAIKTAATPTPVPVVTSKPVVVSTPWPVPAASREMEAAITQANKSSSVRETPQASAKPGLWSHISGLWKKDDAAPGSVGGNRTEVTPVKTGSSVTAVSPSLPPDASQLDFKPVQY